MYKFLTDISLPAVANIINILFYTYHEAMLEKLPTKF